ncbi:phosphate ABC transporter substrate-binding protein [Spirulina sp. 06S082]|uniref:phosphate ABC transporter substrate-binding protein n=1 Tax=Spirulina sp. 06S082 TaxID=3110248 RepID=UPI002B205803|nr:phosphate ABC transporter substrate-binding protein [Spirulina sp. 06S082]MEA5469976.1 phosphate ABC transporter substrate-binding protein [Spirulina sp. 06S082]
MSQKNETLPLILALFITAGILGGGYWWFTRKQSGNLAQNGSVSTAPISNSNAPNSPPPASGTTFPLLPSVPAGTIVNINGSTSMVQINTALKAKFEARYPGTAIVWQSQGTEKGIAAVLAGSAEIAAISRPLTPQEEAQGLVAIPIAQDAIALVVSKNNPFQRGLTQAQVVGIFTGQITDWSQVGGKNSQIRVLNRPQVSGTHQVFQSLVLNGNNFGTSSNIETMPRDETTGMLQELRRDGIGYATFNQVVDQQTVRVVAVDGLTPESANYPYKRELFYVYKNPPTSGVAAFLGYTTSDEGKGAIAGQ